MGSGINAEEGIFIPGRKSETPNDVLGLVMEDRRETPIRYACDVLVIGGGPSGTAAAIAASRA